MSTTTDSITVFLYSGNKVRFEMRLDATITVQEFFRAIQHRTTFGIAKEHLRLKILQDGVWKQFYSWRSRSVNEKSMYKKPLVHFGITDQACLKPKWVLSTSNLFFLGAVGVVAIPTGAAAAMGGAYVAGYVTGAVVGKVAFQRALSSGWVMVLAPDMPSKVLEIKIHD